MPRLSVNISPRTRAELLYLADLHGISMTEVVRRAIGVYEFIDDEVVSKTDVEMRLVSRGRPKAYTVLKVL